MSTDPDILASCVADLRACFPSAEITDDGQSILFCLGSSDGDLRSEISLTHSKPIIIDVNADTETETDAAAGFARYLSSHEVIAENARNTVAMHVEMWLGQGIQEIADAFDVDGAPQYVRDWLKTQPRPLTDLGSVLRDFLGSNVENTGPGPH